MASDKALSWVFAEEFVEENDILAQARETATDLGAEPVSTGVGATLRLLAQPAEQKPSSKSEPEREYLDCGSSRECRPTAS